MRLWLYIVNSDWCLYSASLILTLVTVLVLLILLQITLIWVHVIFQAFNIILLYSIFFFILFLFLINFFFLKILTLFFCPWTGCLHIGSFLVYRKLLVIDLSLICKHWFCRCRSWINLITLVIILVLKRSFHYARIFFFNCFILWNLILINIQFHIHLIRNKIHVFLIFLCHKRCLFKWCWKLRILILRYR